jgi:hypothetical protein
MHCTFPDAFEQDGGDTTYPFGHFQLAQFVVQPGCRGVSSYGMQMFCGALWLTVSSPVFLNGI